MAVIKVDNKMITVYRQRWIIWIHQIIKNKRR